jgi:hypothetical protein
MVLGLVALNALLAQASFRIDDLRSRVDRLTTSADRRSVQAARLASPQRIAAEARDLGLVLPADGTQVLQVPAGTPVQRAAGGVAEGRP